jgi:REP element-mobilizing transposase RayT
VAFYHCVSRIVDRNFVLGDLEKEHFVKLMRVYETFCGVKVVTFCIMTNHFHILLEVPSRPAPEHLPSDEELVQLLKVADASYGAATLAQRLQTLRAAAQHDEADALREHFFSNMWDVSFFMRVLKQRFSQWFNAARNRKGTLWEERFRSVLVEEGDALRTVAAYIDLNPIRAGMVSDPGEYRWSGFGEAVAGGDRSKNSLVSLMQKASPAAKTQQQHLASYRLQLYVIGEEVPSDQNGEGGRRGFTKEQVSEVSQTSGEVSLKYSLDRRVRHFTEGLILGSMAFVQRHVRKYREQAGSLRGPGVSEIRSLGGEALFTVRAFG